MKNKITYSRSGKYISYLHIFIFALIMVLLLTAFSSFYSPTGTLKGKVINKETQQPIPFANVVVLLNDTIMIGGATSDFEGNYTIKPIDPDIYTIKATFVGYKQVIIKGIAINADEVRYYDFELEESSVELCGVQIVENVVPLIDKDQTQSGGTVTTKEIRKMPNRNASSTATTIGGVFSNDRKMNRNRNSRTDKSTIYIDGVRSFTLNKQSDLIKNKSTTKQIISNTEDLEIIPEHEELAGQITAGEIHDFSKWELWEDISAPALSTYQNTWNFYPHKRYCVQVTSQTGDPVIDCNVQLININEELVWESKTDNTGKAELWAYMFQEQKKDMENDFSISIINNEKVLVIEKAKAFHKGINTIEIVSDCNVPQKVDVLFAVDATGSMSDEIKFLKVELKDIIERIIKGKPEIELNLGSVFYRCEGNSYTTLVSPFSQNIDNTISFIKEQSSSEGGVEAVEIALDEAISNMNWSEEAIARLLFIILDEAPGTENSKIEKLNKVARDAAKSGIRIIPIVASGTSFHLDKSLEYLMRSLALATNGTYVFLTDDSGIGNEHTKPSTDQYAVELLNELIPRLFYQFTEAIDCNTIKLLHVGDSNNENTNKIEAIDEQIKDSNDDLTSELEQDNNQSEKLQVFPNPSKGKLTIHSKRKIKEAFLTDISGKLLEKYDLRNNNEKILYLDRFPNGIYFIKYQINEKWETAKVILTR